MTTTVSVKMLWQKYILCKILTRQDDKDILQAPITDWGCWKGTIFFKVAISEQKLLKIRIEHMQLSKNQFNHTMI